MKEVKENKIKWTEKLQTLAAIIAILGGIAGFYTLFSKDKVMQRQINNLATIAKEITKQTQILREELEIDKDKWIKQIRPDFSLDLNTWHDWTGSKDTTTINGFTIINSGGAALLLGIKKNKNNTCLINVQKTFVPKQGKAKLDIKFSQKQKIILDFNLIYIDMEGTKYEQRFISNSFTYDDLSSTELNDLFNLISEKPTKIE